jgi:hypothetical protein
MAMRGGDGLFALVAVAGTVAVADAIDKGKKLTGLQDALQGAQATIDQQSRQIVSAISREEMLMREVQAADGRALEADRRAGQVQAENESLKKQVAELTAKLSAPQPPSKS